MAKALVTGGAGFIGSNLALELENQGYEVTVADNLFSGTKENISGFKGKFIQLDVSKPFELKEKFDVIFHQAAITDPRFGNDNEMIRSNIEGFKSIIDLAIKNNAKLIYASSGSVYGNGKIPMKEDQEKDILSAYAKSKLAMDDTASGYFGKMHIVGLRYFNVFGPREAHKGRPASMVYHLSQQIKAGKNPRIFKFGEQKRDHIHVKDAVDATIMAVKAKKSGVYNVGTGTATTFNDLIKHLNKALGTDSKPEYFDNPYGKTYQANTQAETSNAVKFLGFKSKWKLQDAVKDYMGWIDG
jgi:ADP-L-glycero-D-manno-heptose 6-epimerase